MPSKTPKAEQLTDPALDRFVDRYVGISEALFTETSFAKAVETQKRAGHDIRSSMTGNTSQEYLNHVRFAEKEFNHRVAEMAGVLSKSFDIPRFHFLFTNTHSFTAQASPPDQFTLPLVTLDASYVTFLFMFLTTRIYETYGDVSATQALRLDEMAATTAHSLLVTRRFAPQDIPDFEAWFATDTQLTMLAMSMSRTIAMFIVLHEIAHLMHPNLDGAPQQHIELQADATALKMYQHLYHAGQLEWATIPQGYLGAPIVFFQILRAIERYAARLGHAPRGTHPPALLRRRQAAQILQLTDPIDRDLCRDLRLSLSRLLVKPSYGPRHINDYT